MSTNTRLLKEDFYEYVNAAWLAQAKIPADKPATGGFVDLVDDIDQLLMKDVEEMADGKLPVDTNLLQSFLAYYRLASDYETRNRDGFQPLQERLQKIESLTSYEDLNQQFPQWRFEALPLPVDFYVDADMKNAQTNTLYAAVPSLFLPDKTYYDPEHPNADQLMKVFFDMMVRLLKLAGKNQEEAEIITEEAIAFDKLLAPHVNSAEENADYSKAYNPQAVTDFVKQTDSLDLTKLITGLIGTQPETIIVTEPRYYKALKFLLTTPHFSLMKHWMLVRTVRDFSSLLSEEARQIGTSFSRALSGAEEAMPQKKAAYYLASNQFDQVLGDYYGHKYFGEEAKQDVEQMVVRMIVVYKNRLSANTWLSPATKEKAITKLDSLGIHVGYPKEIPALYHQYKTVPASEGGTLLGNQLRFIELSQRYQFSRWNQPVDRDEWEMSADTVNAYYHPFRNVIVFPAAILQAPFYSLKQSKSANYGGIGAVIAHEISHAFDNNGAKFDEFGNLNNWWTEEDLAHFEKLAQAMIDQFDGLPFANGTVNGTLTVSENIADAGGLSCALEATQLEPEPDLAAFFTNWATIWRNKSHDQYKDLLLAIDVHGPSKLRANVQPKNLDEFYTTFDILPGDGMYLAPEKRVHIW